MFETRLEKVVAWAIGLFVGGIILGAMVGVFVYLPVTAIAEERCLAAGYPKASVTWNLKRYCMNLDGSVTVRVEKLP